MATSERGAASTADVLLIGAGIMSATLGALLKELQPDLTIHIIERLDRAAAESSDAWNNAGTGHSAFCELNYTPQRADGSVDVAKAVQIAESFELSRQFWSYLVERGVIRTPGAFITRIPHMSFVCGDDDVSFLRERYRALQGSPLFHGMQYSEDPAQLAEWMPLVMDGRDPRERVAATRMDEGTDVNFGALTRDLFEHLGRLPGVTIQFGQEVLDLDQADDRRWAARVRDLGAGDGHAISAGFVFIGAGGGSLPLLLKSGIPEGKGFGGFPVSGQWLVCDNPAVIERHSAKVYGKAGVGAPPMSVPHLDARCIDGRQALLFGPYAGFSTKFLKHGSLLDLARSVRPANVFPMLAAGVDNIPLTRYLIEQVLLTPDDRIEALRAFVPLARKEDWRLEVAGQRVQVIKKDPEHGGVLEFGTEVVSGADGSLAALLGASPGASTAVAIMLTLLKRCFPQPFASAEWQAKIREMIPSYGRPLASDGRLVREIRAMTNAALRLAPPLERAQSA